MNLTLKTSRYQTNKKKIVIVYKLCAINVQSNIVYIISRNLYKKKRGKKLILDYNDKFLYFSSDFIDFKQTYHHHLH